MVQIKTPEQIAKMREAGLVVAAIHAATREAAVPGATTKDLDEAARKVLAEHNAKPNFLGYGGFPATICTSVNEVVVHGIPSDDVVLKDGDIISIDCGAIIDGWHGDAAFTVVLPEADPADEALSRATEDAMWAGIAALATGERLGVVGEAVEAAVERSGGGYGIVQEYVGHGIGSAMHQPPDVLNYRTRERGPRLRPGMCLAVEPMLTRGSRMTQVLDDDWTVVTADGSRAAHWEHTVAIGPDGIWVLTAPDGGAERLAALGVTVVPWE